MMKSPYQIALIVLYFGPLPPYFPVWLKSAEDNPDVDFLVWSDQDIQTQAPNFRVTKTTLDELRKRFERTLSRPLVIPNGYKLCDYRPAYGVLFADELRGYDFWGHCDIDMMFGQIRRFLTDEILSAYDRFYAFGAYRNSPKMNRAFELPGSWFTLEETFGPVHVAFDEFSGINLICRKNHILWHDGLDFVHLSANFKTRLNAGKRQPNYPAQIFYCLDGRAFQRYVDRGQIQERELAYIHWLKKSPVPERLPNPGEAVVVTPQRLLVRSPQDLTPENMSRWNPPARRAEAFLTTLKRRARKCRDFVTGSLAFKKIWWKSACCWFRDNKLKYCFPPRRRFQRSGNSADAAECRGNLRRRSTVCRFSRVAPIKGLHFPVKSGRIDSNVNP